MADVLKKPNRTNNKSEDGQLAGFSAAVRSEAFSTTACALRRQLQVPIIRVLQGTAADDFVRHCVQYVRRLFFRDLLFAAARACGTSANCTFGFCTYCKGETTLRNAPSTSGNSVSTNAKPNNVNRWKSTARMVMEIIDLISVVRFKTWHESHEQLLTVFLHMKKSGFLGIVNCKSQTYLHRCYLLTCTGRPVSADGRSLGM